MTKLHVAIQMTIEAELAMQRAVDALLPPTPTGYMHGDESWTVVWAGRRDRAIELRLSPPTGAFEYRCADAEKLAYVRAALGADRVCVRSFRDQPHLTYIATWDEEDPK